MEIDAAIGQVSQLYRAVTGRPLPTSEMPYAPIPAEKDPVQHVQEQVERLLGLLDAPAPLAAPQVWTPPIAIHESASELLVTVDLPGVSRERVTVQLESGMLVVSGERPLAPANGHSPRHVEMRFGPFRRVVPLTPGLRTTEMTARLDAGVLEIRIPRDGAGGVRQVSVA